MTTATRRIRIVPPPAPVCEHGAECFMGCICPTCGTNRRELHAIAGGHASMTAAQRACWMGQCGRDGGQ